MSCRVPDMEVSTLSKVKLSLSTSSAGALCPSMVCGHQGAAWIWNEGHEGSIPQVGAVVGWPRQRKTHRVQRRGSQGSGASPWNCKRWGLRASGSSRRRRRRGRAGAGPFPQRMRHHALPDFGCLVPVASPRAPRLKALSMRGASPRAPRLKAPAVAPLVQRMGTSVPSKARLAGWQRSPRAASRARNHSRWRRMRWPGRSSRARRHHPGWAPAAPRRRGLPASARRCLGAVRAGAGAARRRGRADRLGELGGIRSRRDQSGARRRRRKGRRQRQAGSGLG